MNPKEVARAWIEVASLAAKKEPAPFFRFMTAWIALNAIYSSRMPNAKSERDQVLALASDPAAALKHQESIRSDAGYLQAINAIKAQGVFNYRRSNYRHIGNDLKLKDVLDCTYQIRCNLFHGDKFPDDERDRCLVEAGFKITFEIVRAFI